jgi:hypothetical protein
MFPPIIPARRLRKYTPARLCACAPTYNYSLFRGSVKIKLPFAAKIFDFFQKTFARRTRVW